VKSHPYFAKKKTRAQKLGSMIAENSMALAHLAAKGSEDAAVELHRTAALLTEWLEYVSAKKLELFYGIAQKRPSWPVMYGLHRDELKQTSELIKKLKLGAGTNINYSSGKPFSTEVPANQIALYLHELARALQRAPMNEWDEYEACLLGSVGRFGSNWVSSDPQQLRVLEQWGQSGAGRQLPPLSKSTATNWAKATPKLFRLVFGESFERHPKLQKLKESVLGRVSPEEGNIRPGDIRKAMLQAVKQGWSSIAALD
jgi:hypothetical protein